MIKKLFSIVCIFLLATSLVGCAKPQVTDYQAYLASTQAMNTPEARTVPVFQVSGITQMTGENISIIQREILPPVIPRPKKTGYDVLSEAINPLVKLGGLFLGYKTITDVADTIADASETVIVTNESVVPIEVPGETIVVDVPGETIIVEIPGEPIIIEQPGDPIFVEPWVPPAPGDINVNVDLSGELDLNNVTP